MTKNALQAVLDKAAQADAPVPAKPARTRPVRSSAAPSPAPEEARNDRKFSRPSREATHLIAGHFPKPVAKQLKMMAVEDDTTIQALLQEALDLLFAKKGRATVADLVRRSS